MTTHKVVPRWKSGNEYAPYHPQASHVSPDYRDGWNACYAAAPTESSTAVRGALELVNAQAEDEALWFVARTAPEAYLQQELRKLHAAIERAAPAESAPAVREAMEELVACKVLKDSLDSKLRMTAESEAARLDYERRWPLAWQAAIAALQSTGVSEREKKLRQLLDAAARQLRRWHQKYGEYQPAWLPPAGEVELQEAIADALAAPMKEEGR